MVTAALSVAAVTAVGSWPRRAPGEARRPGTAGELGSGIATPAMRILIVSQYFAPEVTAASLRLEPLAAGLANLGHEVEVVCEAPNHPHGIVPAAYRGRLFTREVRDGYRVSQVWVKASPSKRARARIASYASFAASAIVVGSAMPRCDVVLASSPPLSVGAAGAALAARHRAPLVFDVRDLWPEVAVTLGEIGPGPVLTAAEWLETALYRGSAAITTPTAPFVQQIAGRSGSPETVHLLTNGTTREWIQAGNREPDRAGAGLPEGRFVWTYAGNLGLSQNLEVAIEAARKLGDGFQLLLLGDGTAREKLRELAADVEGEEVVFRAAVPPREAMTLMRASDALLVSLADLPELARTVPVKLYDSCAVRRPVVLAARGEARRLGEDGGAVLAVEPGDPMALAAALRNLRSNRELRQGLSQRAGCFAEGSLREHGVGQLANILEQVVR